MSNPLVSIIIPSTHDRVAFNESILNQMILQDYKEKEILWDFEPGTIGEKRNRLCEKANGTIICAADSDDYYKPDWVSHSVKHLLDTGAAIAGLSQMYLYDLESRELFIYKYPEGHQAYVPGATMCFQKAYWEKSPFTNIMVGEDYQFCCGRWNTELKEVVIPIVKPHNYMEGFVASIHSGNTSKRNTTGEWWVRQSKEEAERICREFNLDKV
jgi:hypothetical protein